MRYKIIKPVDCDWKDFAKMMRELQQETRAIMNKTVNFT
jgi:hypothetical protein